MAWSDAELVERLKNRDAEAAEQLVTLYADRLYNYAYYHCGDHHLAEDIVAETFARVIEKVGKFVLKEFPFKAWIFRIAHNLLVDHFRQNKRYSRVSIDTIDWSTDQIYSPTSDWGAADGGNIADLIVERLELNELITRLPEDQRTVFILRFVEGFDLQQVAVLLDRTQSSIKSLQFRAVRNLRRALDEQEDNLVNSEVGKKARQLKRELSHEQ